MAQISVDVAWSPCGIDGRNYDVLGLAAAADLLFVMAYDMQSQVGRRTYGLMLVVRFVDRALHAVVMKCQSQENMQRVVGWYGSPHVPPACQAGMRCPTCMRGSNAWCGGADLGPLRGQREQPAGAGAARRAAVSGPGRARQQARAWPALVRQWTWWCAWTSSHVATLHALLQYSR